MSVTALIALSIVVLLIRFGPALLFNDRRVGEDGEGVTKPEVQEHYADNYARHTRGILIALLGLLLVALPVSFVVEFFVVR